MRSIRFRRLQSERSDHFHGVPCVISFLCSSNVVANTYASVDARHRFTAEDPDWGFAKFSVLEKLLNAQEGRSRPTIENGEIEITVYVRVMEDPSGVLWHTLKSERRELFVKVNKNIFIAVSTSDWH